MSDFGDDDAVSKSGEAPQSGSERAGLRGGRRGDQDEPIYLLPRQAKVPITEKHIRMIIAELHDQGRGHVLADMIEGVTGERLPDGMFHPRKFSIRDPVWNAARKKLKEKRHTVSRRTRRTPEQKAARLAELKKWEAENPDKMAEIEKRRQVAAKEERKSKFFAGVDLEGFDTGRYFTDDRRDYARELHEGIARGDNTFEEACEHIRRLHVPPDEQTMSPFEGWTVHDHKWYLAQHDLTKDDPYPCAANRKPRAPEIYIEHRPFLFGVGNDGKQYFLTEDSEWTTDRVEAMSEISNKKKPLSAHKILSAIADLRKIIGDAVFVTFAFNYDVAQILRCLDDKTAGELQAGEVIIRSTDDNGAPCEDIIEQATFFWNEFAIAYRRGKMFRVGRLNDPANPYKYKEITNPERRQAYIDAGRDPVTREIDYKDDPVTLNDTFGFFQMSFIEAYEGSGISFTREEAEIIVEGKRKRRIMASLPMNKVIGYQGIELRILCRMMDKVRETMIELGLDLPHWMGAGSISAAMANKHRTRDFYPNIRSENYKPVQDWAHYCFAGGNIQMVKQGRVPALTEEESAELWELSDEEADKRGFVPNRHQRRAYHKLYGYDITSAYPSILYKLAAMALPIEWETKKDGSLGQVTKRIEGKWEWREGAELTEDIIKTMSIYSMIEVEFAFPEKCYDPKQRKLKDAPWYPLFYRCKDGSILFARRGIGRYYRDELLEAFEWVRQSRPDMTDEQRAKMIKIRGGFEFICPTINDLTAEQLETMKTNCPSARIDEAGFVYPFQYIKDYYDERARYPKTDARNKYLKLGCNGSWGKLAQSVGGRKGMPPASASPWYAGVVTAGTRAKCVRAGLSAPWNIIHFATDGIQSDAPLEIENDKKLLGEWEMDTFTRGVYVKPGIYAFVDDREQEGEEESVLDEFVATHVYKGKSRGVSLRSILGEDDEETEKRDIQEEWFDYLDKLAEYCYGNGRPTAILPHKKLLTFGGAATCPDRWPMCGNWIESSRIFKMNTAGIKRAVCLDIDRAHSLVITRVATNGTPKVLSARHEPEWLGDAEAPMRDLHDNQDLALANDWQFAWDFEERSSSNKQA